MPRKTSTKRVGKAKASKVNAASTPKKAAKTKVMKAKVLKAKVTKTNVAKTKNVKTKAEKEVRKTKGRGVTSKTSARSTVSASKPSSRNAKQTSRSVSPRRKTVAKKKPAVSRQVEAKITKPDDVLARAEADITAAIDSLNNRMNQAMTSLTELAVAQGGPKEAVVRTAPLDRATATFQRLIREVVDDQMAEMLPPLIALRNELASYEGCPDSGDEAFPGRGRETIDQILATAEVQPFHARVGETFDPLIHLAVGETNREDLSDGVVTEAFQPGFRSARGKVFQTARVKVNRR